MNDDDRTLESIRGQLRTALPPWRDLELETDLWPHMRRRLEESRVRFGWRESVVAALIVLTLAIFPELIPVVLYHL
jgi:hypothetical protein